MPSNSEDSNINDVSTNTAGEESQAAEAAEDSAATSPESGQVSLTVSKALLKKIVAVVVAVALIALIGVGIWQWIDKSRQLSAFDDVQSSSNTFVTALVSTMNSENTGNTKDILGPLTTGDLHNRMSQERKDTEKSVSDLKLKVTSKVLVSAVESFDTKNAKSLVMAEVTGTSATLPSGAANLMVFRLDLSKVDGKWLVSKFDGPPGSRDGRIDPSQSLPGAGGATPSATPTPTPTG